MKFALIFVALFAVAFAQYETYQEGAGVDAGAYAPEAAGYEGETAYGGEAPTGYEDAGAAAGYEQEGGEHHGAEAYGAGSQYEAPQTGYEQYEAYV